MQILFQLADYIYKFFLGGKNMLNKIIKVKGNKDIRFAVNPPVIFGAFRAKRTYKCVKETNMEYEFAEQRAPIFQQITIKKAEFEKIKAQLEIS